MVSNRVHIGIQNFLKSVLLDSVGRYYLNNNNNLFIESPDLKSEVTEKLTSLDRKLSKEMKTVTDDLKNNTEGNFFY